MNAKYLVLFRHCESPISFSFFRFRFGRRVSSSLGGPRVLPPSCTHCLFMGRTSPPGRTSKYTPRTPHPQQQATPHTPGWTSSPPPAGLQINILIARLIYTASRSSLGRGRTSSLVRAASHTTPLCGSNHSLLPHP